LDFHAHPLSLLRGLKLYHRQTLLANISIANSVRPGTLPERRQHKALLLFTRPVPRGCLFCAAIWSKVFCAGGIHASTSGGGVFPVSGGSSGLGAATAVISSKTLEARRPREISRGRAFFASPRSEIHCHGAPEGMRVKPGTRFHDRVTYLSDADERDGRRQHKRRSARMPFGAHPGDFVNTESCRKNEIARLIDAENAEKDRNSHSLRSPRLCGEDLTSRWRDSSPARLSECAFRRMTAKRTRPRGGRTQQQL
jgi:hypothetical protein